LWGYHGRTPIAICTLGLTDSRTGLPHRSAYSCSWLTTRYRTPADIHISNFSCFELLQPAEPDLSFKKQVSRTYRAPRPAVFAVGDCSLWTQPISEKSPRLEIVRHQSAALRLLQLAFCRPPTRSLTGRCCFWVGRRHRHDARHGERARGLSGSRRSTIVAPCNVRDESAAFEDVPDTRPRPIDINGRGSA
jgi:hypothetical protein